MKKSFISAIFTLVLAILFTQNASASEDFDQKINELADKYNVELVDLENTAIDNNTFLEFDDLEQFEEFLKQATENDSISTTEVIVVEPEPENILAFASFAASTKVYNDSHETSWWGPLNGPVMGVLNMRNMSFDYSYKFVDGKPKFVDVTNIDSWQTGYHDVKWTHKKGSKTFNKTKDTTNVVAKGLYTLGVVIANHPIGYSWNGEWDRNLTLTSK